MAVRMPACVLTLRRRLRRRLTHPLFNTRKWVTNWDNALLTMWSVHARGEPPRDLDMPDVAARHAGHGA